MSLRTNIQEFTAAGAGTWTKLSGAVKVVVEEWGAGGLGGVGYIRVTTYF